MKERPILFSAPMVRAILDGSKTQTRRICKPAEASALARVIPAYKPDNGEQRPPYFTPGWFGDEEGDVLFFSPHGAPGDRLWVRETCRAEELEYAGWEDGVRYLADNHWRGIENTKEAADAWIELNSYRGQKGVAVPSIHMPRWASRILLEIVGVRVERLQDISEEDAIAEGIEQHKTGLWLPCAEKGKAHIDPRRAYRDLWESINGPGSWDANPWVWVIEFKRIQRGDGI